MAAKKKTKKKQTRSRKAGKNMTPAKKLVRRKTSPKKKSAKKQPAQKKVVAKTKGVAKRAAGAKTVSALKKRLRVKRQSVNTVTYSAERARARSGGQSGDLQGLSSIERASSESVDELLEEGNAFEAEVVAGVEDAGNAGEKEVRTHEVPEDDVPEEYLDKDL